MHQHSEEPSQETAIVERAKVLRHSIDELIPKGRRTVEQEILPTVESIAWRYSRAPSDFLAGVIGGVVVGGPTLAVVALTVGTTSFFAMPLVALGTALGIACGVFRFRGRNHRRVERSSAKRRIAWASILADINSLPPSAPADLRDRMYRDLARIQEDYAAIVCNSLDDSAK
jgi:hypothetical protein